MTIDAESWVRLGGLFDELADQPPEHRALHDLELPARVRVLLDRMLAAHDAGDEQLLDRTLGGLAGELIGNRPDPDDAFPGRLDGFQFGNWQAGGEIARGGMSVVLHGRRADGHFEKRVAIKVMSPGAGDHVHRERLLEEIRLLARLEHAGIARLIDGGISREGFPYLVMEYVDGVPITVYCQRKRLSLPGRVRLFMQAVDAVAYAHRHLVVHCDIKPGNVLVTDEGQVKLVDFGIAALIGQGRDEDSPRGVFCSPGYAAPEQFAGAKPATAQDVYGLGALLYHLLCGRRVRSVGTFTRLTTRSAAGEAVAPPSTRLDGRDARALRGDLDAICMRAVAVEPDDRYATANALRQDLTRWLGSEPVQARNGGTGYLLARWLKRRRWLAAGGALVAASLLAGISVALWQAERARTAAAAARAEAGRAESVSGFLESIFRSADPRRAEVRDVSARELVDDAVARIRGSTNFTPATRARIIDSLVTVQMSLGRFGDARALADEALATLPPDPEHRTQRLKLELQLAETRMHLGEFEDSTAMLQRIAGELPLASPVDPLALYAHSTLLRSMAMQGTELDRQQALLEQLLPYEDTIRASHPSTWLALKSTQLNTLLTRGDYRRVAEVARAAVAWTETELGPDHPAVADMLNWLSSAQFQLGRPEQAEVNDRKMLAIYLDAFGEDHPLVLNASNQLATSLAQQGRYRDALEYYHRALAGWRRLYDNRHLDITAALINIGQAHRQLDQPDAALANLQEAWEMRSALLGSEHPHTGFAQVLTARIQGELGRHETADANFRAGLEALYRAWSDSHPLVLRLRAEYALFRVRAGQPAEALEALAEIVPGLKEAYGADSVYPALADTYAGMALLALGRPDEAEPRLVNAYETLSESDALIKRYARERATLEAAMAELHRARETGDIAATD